MSKGVFKEIIIILLLVIAVILLLGILLYDYVPLNKVIPEKITYSVTDEIKSALQEEKAVSDEEVVLTYEVTSTDLKNYQRINEYKAGRKNPFEDVTNPETNTTTETAGTTNNQNSGTASGSSTSGTNTGTSSNSGSTSNQNNNSTSTNYYPDKGTK